jgi:hypothetical protein
VKLKILINNGKNEKGEILRKEYNCYCKEIDETELVPFFGSVWI